MTGILQPQVGTGGWDDTALNEQNCNVCTKNDIGDEYHYLFSCDFLRVTEIENTR